MQKWRTPGMRMWLLSVTSKKSPGFNPQTERPSIRSTITRRSNSENSPIALRVRLAPVEATAGRLHLHVPCESAKLRLELSGIMEDLDRAELPAVFQLAEDGIPLDSPLHSTSLLGAELVDEEDPAVGGERVANHLPERRKPVVRHMGKPEGEEHEVVPPIRSPRKNVGEDVAHVGSVDPLPVERHHLVRRIDRGHVLGVLCEPLRPPAGA